MKQSVWRKRMKKVMGGTAVFILLLLLTGVIYQAWGTKADQQAYTAPGQMVDVGGYKMHIYCTGVGSPTVILDHVGAANSAEWALIQPVVAAQTRVCAYDRAGFGWSEPGAEPRDAEHGAQELHTLLANAKVDGPYVLVGHSYGANVSRVFAADFPEEISGLVLVDPGSVFSRPGVSEIIDPQLEAENAGFMKAAPILSRIGLVRLAGALGAIPGHVDLPSPQGEAFDVLQRTNQFWDTVKAQNSAMVATSEQVLAAEKHLESFPLIVLSASQPEGDQVRQVFTEVNTSIAALSANGDHRVVTGADYMGLTVNQQYAQVTAEAILDMVTAVQGQ